MTSFTSSRLNHRARACARPARPRINAAACAVKNTTNAHPLIRCSDERRALPLGMALKGQLKNASGNACTKPV